MRWVAMRTPQIQKLDDNRWQGQIDFLECMFQRWNSLFKANSFLVYIALFLPHLRANETSGNVRNGLLPSEVPQWIGVHNASRLDPTLRVPVWHKIRIPSLSLSISTSVIPNSTLIPHTPISTSTYYYQAHPHYSANDPSVIMKLSTLLWDSQSMVFPSSGECLYMKVFWKHVAWEIDLWGGCMIQMGM